MNSTNWRRWLPSNPALISGALTSAVMFAANRLGIHLLSYQVQEAITPLVSFAVASIVHRNTTAPVVTPPSPPAPSLASTLAGDIEQRLADPEVQRALVNAALSLLANPQTVSSPPSHLPQT